MPFIFRIKCRSRVLILSSHSIFLPNCLHFPHTGRWQAIWCNLRTFLGRLETSLFSMKLAMWTRQIPFPVYFILTDNVYQLWLYECKKSHIPTIKQSICSIWNSKIKLHVPVIKANWNTGQVLAMSTIYIPSMSHFISIHYINGWKADKDRYIIL
jgi:hypothetical protein